jgi:hypothetical protein
MLSTTRNALRIRRREISFEILLEGTINGRQWFHHKELLHARKLPVAYFLELKIRKA